MSDLVKEGLLTQDKLKELLDYDSCAGIFTRKVSGNGVNIGDIAGRTCNTGYIAFKVNGKEYLAHRLAWLYVHSVWPKNKIDHKDRNKTNNRIDNLRDVSDVESSQNLPLKVNNTSGIVGVHWIKALNKWCARITVNKHVLELGVHAGKFEAACVRKSAERRYGFHPNHGVSNNE